MVCCNKNLINLSINYVNILNKLPILTLREEKLLILKLKKDNDILSAHYLIISHLRFVFRIAKTYLGYGILLSDLIQEGTIGLMKSILNFNPSRNNRLISYAIYNIKAEINEYVIKNWSIVKVATTKEQRKLFFNIKTKKKNLDSLNEFEISCLSKDLNVPKKSVLSMYNRLQRNDHCIDRFNDKDIINLENTFEQKIALFKLRFVVKLFLKKLDFRSNFILKSRWLIAEKVPLHILGTLFKLSTERIRQIEKNVLDKLAFLCLYLAH